jgi:dihydroorotate dehydrogenase (fumarate)
MPNLKTKYLGLELKNPIIAASSGFTDTVDKIIDLEEKGCSSIVLKSIFEEEILREAELEAAEMMKNHEMRESFDYIDHHLKGIKINRYINLINDSKNAVSIPIIASINCSSGHEWLYFAKNIEESGADAIELNMFILPSNPNKTAQDIEEQYLNILRKVRSEIKIPVAVKTSYYFANLSNMMLRIAETGIDGIVMFNRQYSPDFDINELKLTRSNVLSSPREQLLPLRWIALLSDKLNCSIAASTGIHDGEDAIKMLLAGADVAQLASTLYRNGTSQITNIIKKIEDWMTIHKYESISDFRGKMSFGNIENPHNWERVQFMKYFSEIGK